MRTDIEFVGAAESVATGRDKVDELNTDVLLLDYRLPNENALAYIRELRARAQSAALAGDKANPGGDQPLQRGRPAVLMHSGYVRAAHVQESLAAGAWGFVGKEVDPEELARAIHKVHEGAVVFSESARRVLTKKYGGNASGPN